MSSVSATGFVHDMLKQNMNFKQFMLLCAQHILGNINVDEQGQCSQVASGKLALLSASLATAIEKRNIMEKFTEQEQNIFALNNRAVEILKLTAAKNEEEKEAQHIRAMIENVTQWHCVDELLVLKSFMLSQLSQSIYYSSTDIYQKMIDELESLTPVDFFQRKLNGVYDDIVFLQNSINAEIKDRAQERDVINQLQSYLDTI